VSLGLERTTAIGNVGAYLDWTSGTVNNHNQQSLGVNNIEFNAFWRKAFGNLYTFARVGYGKSSFKLDRTFSGVVDGRHHLLRHGGWKGHSLSATGGFTYDFPERHVQDQAQGEHRILRLKENGYQETGTDAIILLVRNRTSTAVNATTTLGFSWSRGPSSYEGRPFTVEADFGRRSHLAGDLGRPRRSSVRAVLHADPGKPAVGLDRLGRHPPGRPGLYLEDLGRRRKAAERGTGLQPARLDQHRALTGRHATRRAATTAVAAPFLCCRSRAFRPVCGRCARSRGGHRPGPSG
jgi:hypothetical protein